MVFIFLSLELFSSNLKCKRTRVKMFVMSRWAVLLWLFFTFAAADFIKSGNENANGTEKPNRTALHSGNEYKESKRFRQHRLNATEEASKNVDDAKKDGFGGVIGPDQAQTAKPAESVVRRHSIKTKHKLKRMWHDLPNEQGVNNTKSIDVNKNSDDTKELIKSSVNDTSPYDTNVGDHNNKSLGNNGRSAGTHDQILIDERNKAKQINVDEAETSSHRPKIQRIIARTETSSAANFNTPSHRKKRRRLILSSTQSVPIDTRSPYYSNFQPIQQTLPSEQFPFSDFGRKIAGAGPRGNVNFVDSLLTEIRNNAKPPLEPKLVPEEDVVHEDMDVTVDKKTIEKNHPPNDRVYVSTTNLANYYRRPTIKPANYTLSLNTTSLCPSPYRVRRPYLGNKTLKREVSNSTLCQNSTITTSKPEEPKLTDKPDIKKFLKARQEQSTWRSAKNDINQITETTRVDSTTATTKILSTAVITSVSVKSNDIDETSLKPFDSYISIESDDEPEPSVKKSKSDKLFDNTYNSTGIVFSAFNKTKTIQPNARSSLMFYQRNSPKNFRTLNRNMQFSKIFSQLQSQVRPTVNTSNVEIQPNPQIQSDNFTDSTFNISQPSVEYLMNSNPTTESVESESEPVGVEVTTMNDVFIQNSTVIIVSVNDHQEQNASTLNTDLYNYSTPSTVTYEYTENLKYHTDVQNDTYVRRNHTQNDKIYAIFAEPAILNYTRFEKPTTMPPKINAIPVTGKPNSEELGIGYQIGFHIVTYVLAGLGIIPLVIGIILITKMILSQNKKQIFEGSEYSSEYNRNPLDFHGGVTSSPIATKLPRVPHHMAHWEIEKKAAAATITLPNNSKWEFPRDKLRLQTILGQGNFGQVWKAEADDISGHEGLTRLVAVKMVKEISSTREKEDLIRELVIMQHLGSHPNVVTLLGCCTEKEPYMLIMEYVMYGKLLSFLRDHRTRSHYFNFSDNGDTLTSRDLTVFAYCVARGMEYLQNKQVIHRDLAARNILVDHNKLCKIADFGMSRHVGESGQVLEHRQSKGALPIRWMAPESLHYSCYTHKTDVWSFGVLMWEIVTLGSMPYASMGARVVMRKVKEGYRLEKPKYCKSQLFNVISKCWYSDPNKRPTFTDLKQDLANLLEDPEHCGNYVDLDSLVEEMNQVVHGSHNEKIII